MHQPWVAIQRNPNSGTGRRRHRLLELISSLRRLGLRPRVFSRREKMDLHLADTESRRNLLCIVAAGGDGTAADVVNRFPDVPMIPFALGTENLLARYLKIPDRGESAAEVIAKGKLRTLDTAIVNQRRFLLMVSAGFDGDVVHRLHAARTGNITRMTYLRPLWQTTFNYHYPQAKVFVDYEQEPICGSLVMVFNLPTYGLGLPIIPHATGDDGLLDVVVFRDPGTIKLLGYGFSVMTGNHISQNDVVFRTAQRIRIESDQTLPVQADGDPAGLTPVDIQIQPGAMKVVVP